MLNSFSQIRPRERRAAYASLFILFGIVAGLALLETARDALFLSRLPASRLPWVYLSIAVLSLGIFALQERRPLRIPFRDRYPVTWWLLGAGVVTLGLWLLMDEPGTWELYVLYTWPGVFATLVIVRFWTHLGDLFTVSQAKRLFAPIGVGSALGAIVGSALARLLVMNREPQVLILAAAGVLLVTAAVPLLLPRPETAPLKRRRDGVETGWARSIRTIWKGPYLRRIGALLLVSTVALTLVDFLFKYTVAARVPADHLGAFFSGAYLVFNLLSLLLQAAAVGWMLRALSVNRVLSVLPLLLIGGSLGVLFGGGLVAAAVLKGVDGSLRYSLHRTATEVLFVPLTGEVRARVKGLLDILGQRGGQALASLVILPVVVIGAVPMVIAGLILVLGALWIRLASTLKTHYLNLFRETLSEVALQTRFDFPELDLASLETLISALNSSNDSEVLATLDLLAEQDRTRLIPALILYHPSSKVVTRSLELFARSGREDFLPISERLLEHPEPEVRAATLRSLAWIAPRPDLYRNFESDPSPVVKATALVGMVSYGAEGAAAAEREVERLAREGLPEEKLALARAISYSPGAAWEKPLMLLAESQSIRVRLAAIAAMREILSYSFIPRLLEMLPNRNLRLAARSTLIAMGSGILEKLEAALGDRSLDPSIRRQIPRTLGDLAPVAAAPVLMKNLLEETDGAVRYRSLRALGRIVSRNPGLDVDRTRLMVVIEDTLKNTFQLMQWRVRLVSEPTAKSPVREMIESLLRHKERLATERIFRLLGICHPRDDLRNIYRGIRSANPKVQASSRELLEDLLEHSLRDPILTLVDDVPDREKIAGAGRYAPGSPPSYEALLRTLLRRGNVGMRCLVLYHIGELGMVDLRKDVENAERDGDGMVERSVGRTLERLSLAANKD